MIINYYKPVGVAVVEFSKKDLNIHVKIFKVQYNTFFVA